MPRLRVSAAGPPLCTGVITLHFTPPVTPPRCDSVFEQHVQGSQASAMHLYTRKNGREISSKRSTHLGFVCVYLKLCSRWAFVSTLARGGSASASCVRGASRFKCRPTLYGASWNGVGLAPWMQIFFFDERFEPTHPFTRTVAPRQKGMSA